MFPGRFEFGRGDSAIIDPDGKVLAGRSSMRVVRCLSVIASLAVSQPAGACSLIPGLMPTWRAGQALMLATSTSDTVRAGPGSVKWREAPGHNGATGRAVIYGQVMIVDSSRGPGASASGRAVLVPWDYGPDCMPTPWGGTAKWRRPGTYGLYKAILREPKYWAAGLPTYDVFAPEFEPYSANTGGTGTRGRMRDTLPPLSAEEVFAAAKHLASSDHPDSLLKFIEWAVANRSISQRPPLSEAEGMAVYQVRLRGVRSLPVPIKGTYRITATLSGGDSVTFYARTDSIPSSAWDLSDRPQQRLSRSGIAPVLGYHLIISVGPDAQIPHHTRDESYFYLPVNSTSDSAGGQMFEGMLQPDIMGIAFPGSAFAQRFRRASDILPATFSVTPSGRATFIHRSVLSDGRELVIRGERISSEAGR